MGLGKTYVAKGIIRALAYKEAKKYFALHRDKDSFDYRVLYLCPNLNIANQNKEKLELEIPQIPAASQGASGNKEEADKEEADTEEASSEGNSVPPEKKTDAVFYPIFRFGSRVKLPVQQKCSHSCFRICSV